MFRQSLFSIVFLAAVVPAIGLAQSSAVPPAQDVSLDPSTAGIAAVNRASELLKNQTPEAAISYFNDALAQAKNFAVQRCIRFHLCELYAQAGRLDKALEMLKEQIASIPQVASPTLVQFVPAETPGSTAATPQQ